MARSLLVSGGLGTDGHATRHVRMYRAVVIVGVRPIKPTAKACSRQQEIRALFAVMILQPVRRAVVIGPSYALTGSYRDLSRRELKVDDRNLSAILDCRRRCGLLDYNLVWRVADRDRCGLAGCEIDDGRVCCRGGECRLHHPFAGSEREKAGQEGADHDEQSP